MPPFSLQGKRFGLRCFLSREKTTKCQMLMFPTAVCREEVYLAALVFEKHGTFTLLWVQEHGHPPHRLLSPQRKVNVLSTLALLAKGSFVDTVAYLTSRSPLFRCRGVCRCLRSPLVTPRPISRTLVDGQDDNIIIIIIITPTDKNTAAVTQY